MRDGLRRRSLRVVRPRSTPPLIVLRKFPTRDLCRFRGRGSPHASELAAASAKQPVDQNEDGPLPADVHAALAGILEACDGDPFMIALAPPYLDQMVHQTATIQNKTANLGEDSPDTKSSVSGAFCFVPRYGRMKPKSVSGSQLSAIKRNSDCTSATLRVSR